MKLSKLERLDQYRNAIILVCLIFVNGSFCLIASNEPPLPIFTHYQKSTPQNIILLVDLTWLGIFFTPIFFTAFCLKNLKDPDNITKL